MESSSWPESVPSNRIQAIQELNQGQDLINILCEMLWLPKKIECNDTSEDRLVVQILGMFENTLSIMSSCSSNESHQIMTTDIHSPSSSDEPKSKSFNKNLRIVIPEKIKRGCYKRRKNSWTSTQVSSALVDDGHAWRKYGQKQILNSEHQRSYYRFTYKFDQGCQATKQVQQIQDKPPKYKTIYNGNHTCKNLRRAPEIILDCPDPRDTSILLSFETKGFVEKKQVNSNFCAIKHELQEEFPSIGNSTVYNGQLSSNNCLSWDSNASVSKRPLEPISMTSTTLDHGDDDMIFSEAYSYIATTHVYEMEHMPGRNDFNDFPYELCF